MGKIWSYISNLGIDEEILSPQESKIRTFFNRCIFVGFFSLVMTIISMYPFIGAYSLLNLIPCGAIILAFYLQRNRQFHIAKRAVVYSIYGVGLYTTAISGGDFLYHTGIITVLTFSWIMFSPKNELFELILFFLLSSFGYIIGELNLFHAPDFTNHPNTPSSRIINLIGYTGVTIIFISFIRRLNIQYETDLELKKSKLEQEVLERTKELEIKNALLESQNNEKEVLLKEIHHRVKNNLQIIVSLLNLQLSKFNDPNVVDAINETQNRIVSMSLVHQKMYQTNDSVAVDMKNYVDSLYDNVHLLFKGQLPNVNLINNIPDGAKFDVESAIPLGLMINELITNSFKHAFDESKAPNVIRFELAIENRQYSLTYKDNGKGLPKDLEERSTDSLGLELIQALADQINGKVNLYNNDGAIFEITFSV